MVKFMMKRFVQLKVFNRMHLVKKKRKKKKNEKEKKMVKRLLWCQKKSLSTARMRKENNSQIFDKTNEFKKKIDSKIRIQFDFVFLFRNRIRIDLFLNIKKIEQLKSPLDSICVVSSSENGPSKNRIEIHPNLIALLFLFFFLIFFFEDLSLQYCSNNIAMKFIFLIFFLNPKHFGLIEINQLSFLIAIVTRSDAKEIKANPYIILGPHKAIEYERCRERGRERNRLSLIPDSKNSGSN